MSETPTEKFPVLKQLIKATFKTKSPVAEIQPYSPTQPPETIDLTMATPPTSAGATGRTPTWPAVPAYTPAAAVDLPLPPTNIAVTITEEPVQKEEIEKTAIDQLKSCCARIDSLNNMMNHTYQQMKDLQMNALDLSVPKQEYQEAKTSKVLTAEAKRFRNLRHKAHLRRNKQRLQLLESGGIHNTEDVLDYLRLATARERARVRKREWAQTRRWERRFASLPPLLSLEAPFQQDADNLDISTLDFYNSVDTEDKIEKPTR